MPRGRHFTRGGGLVTPGDLGDELASFIRAMRANNVSPNTITAYGGAVRQFGLWPIEHGYPTEVDATERRHVEERITSILEHRKLMGAELWTFPQAGPGTTQPRGAVIDPGRHVGAGVLPSPLLPSRRLVVLPVSLLPVSVEPLESGVVVIVGTVTSTCRGPPGCVPRM